MLKLLLITFSKMLFVFIISSLFQLEPVPKLESVCSADRYLSLEVCGHLTDIPYFTWNIFTIEAQIHSMCNGFPRGE